MRRKTHQAGFTLLEMLIVVAIIAVVISIVSLSLVRTDQRMTIEMANVRIKGLLEQARSLAAVAGSRVGTNRMSYGPTCTDETAASPGDFAQWQLWVRYNNGQLEVPSSVTIQGDSLQVGCETYDIAAETNNLGQFTFPLGPVDVAFMPSGRAIIRGQPGPFAYFQVVNPADGLLYGTRVLPSGVVCTASVLAGPPWCD
ncbi:MAG: prepilin-type N-terminal cleavage/methylation domain-containing protein [Myxococcota bacterium]